MTLSRPFFNPTLGQKIGLEVRLSRVGSLTVLILDRDGHPVRSLVSRQPVHAETLWYDWDGKDDRGRIVPDEAYSLKIDVAGHGFASSYFPANEPHGDVRADIAGYDRRTAILSYTLSAPARVHAQAGISRVDERTKERDGPVLKTIANREPRPAGAVVENWDGFDETGTYYVPDLPNFAVAVAATALPENAIIAVGNSSRGFVEGAAARTEPSLLPRGSSSDHRHHKGLDTLDDVSPTLRAVPSNARWSSSTKTWTVTGTRVSGSVSMDGPSAARFARQPAELEIFLDDRRVRVIPSPVAGMRFGVSLDGATPGPHILAFNWSSDYGPVAASSFRIQAGNRHEASTTGDASSPRGANR